MTKDDLILDLKSKFYYVKEPAIRQGEEGIINKYVITVYEKNGDILSPRNINFYVEKEGEVDEAAYWATTEPEPMPPLSFRAEVDAYIQTKIDAGAIDGAFIDDINEEREIAFGRAYVDQAGTLTEIKVFLDKDGGNLRHRAIG